MTIDKFPSFLAVLTFLALSIVLPHEWGCFGVIGLDFLSLYTTHDYIGLLLIGIGASFGFLAFWLGVQIAFFPDYDFKQPKSKLGRLDRPWIWITWTAWFIAVLLFQDDTWRFSMYILLALLSFRVGLYVLSRPGFADIQKSGPAFAVLILFLPGLMLCSYGRGHDSAYFDLKHAKPLYVLKLKNQDASYNVTVLRLIDKGAIVFDPTTKAVQFYQNESISLLSKQAPEWDERSFACRHFGWPC
jgi:hypothetical protein